MILKAGQKVRLKEDGRIYTVIADYGDNKYSLGLYDYPDTEQDYLTDINEIEEVIE